MIRDQMQLHRFLTDGPALLIVTALAVAVAVGLARRWRRAVHPTTPDADSPISIKVG